MDGIQLSFQVIHINSFSSVKYEVRLQVSIMVSQRKINIENR